MNEDEKKKEEATIRTQHSESTESELTRCLKEREEYLNGWKRAKADFINYQREENKRFEEIAKFASLGLIEDFIPVLDSFAALERSIEGEPRLEGVSRRDLDGMRLIHAQCEDVLKKKGLERIPFTSGGAFDPKIHESVGEIESVHPPGTLAEEIERGYALEERVVRAARVKLSKAKL